MQRIVVLNPKGGSGKTTLAINLAAYFAARGDNTLLIDRDPQGSATRWLRKRKTPQPAITGIATSGLRAASSGIQAAAHNLANLATPDATRQSVALSAEATGGVSATVVEAPADPAAPVEDVAAMLTYKAMAGANLFVLKVADQTLGSLLDIRA